MQTELSNVHAELKVNTEITRGGLAALSAQLASCERAKRTTSPSARSNIAAAGVYAMPHQLSTFVTRLEEKISSTDLAADGPLCVLVAPVSTDGQQPSSQVDIEGPLAFKTPD